MGGGKISSREGQKVTAFFCNRSMLGHRRSQDFGLGGGGQTTCNDKKLFVDRDIVEAVACVMAHNQNFAEKRELKSPKKCKFVK